MGGLRGGWRKQEVGARPPEQPVRMRRASQPHWDRLRRLNWREQSPIRGGKRGGKPWRGTWGSLNWRGAAAGACGAPAISRCRGGEQAARHGLGPGRAAAAEQRPLRGLHQTHLGTGEGRSHAPARPLGAWRWFSSPSRGGGEALSAARPSPAGSPGYCRCPTSLTFLGGEFCLRLPSRKWLAVWQGLAAFLRPSGRRSEHLASGRGSALLSLSAWPPSCPRVSLVISSIFYLCIKVQELNSLYS